MWSVCPEGSGEIGIWGAATSAVSVAAPALSCLKSWIHLYKLTLLPRDHIYIFGDQENVVCVSFLGHHTLHKYKTLQAPPTWDCLLHVRKVMPQTFSLSSIRQRDYFDQLLLSVPPAAQ